MTDILLASLTAYIMAAIVAVGSIFENPRMWLIRSLPWLKIGNNKHFFECRLCLSFWTSCIAVFMFSLSWKMILPVYGFAYFLATQER